MATSQSDAAKMEQIFTELFAKSLHIILESRTPSSSSVPSTPSSSSSSSSSSVQPRDKWFNLALKECPAALEQLNLCSPEYMVVDIILAEKLLGFDLQDNFPDKKQVSDVSIKEADGMKEKIIERWVVQYKLEKNEVLTKKSSRRSLSSLYKKSMLLLRSLYATVRLLPAYKVFRQLNLQGHLCSCFLAHRVSPSAKPFSNRQKAEMQLYDDFTPVDTSSGRLCISVLYLPKLSDVAPRKSNSMSHKIIKEYVGSPLVSPVKRFCSFYGVAEADVASSSLDMQSLPNFNRRIANDKDAVVNKKQPWNYEAGVGLRPPRPQFEISCAFDDVDGDNPIESNSRNSNLSVGGLVDMLQKAQPLTREFASSGKETLKKTTTDAALIDLAGFVKLKDLLMGGGDSRTPQSSIELHF